MTTNYEQRKSGLVVPAAKPSKPERRYGPLEVQDEDARRVARDALLLLWDAMDLSRPPTILMPGETRAAYDAHRKAYRYVGEMLLGDECPEKEVFT